MRTLARAFAVAGLVVFISGPLQAGPKVQASHHKSKYKQSRSKKSQSKKRSVRQHRRGASASMDLKKKGQSVESLNEAHNKSIKDQNYVKRKAHFDTEKMRAAWESRQSSSIKIPSAAPAVGAGEIFIEAPGEDHSGLKGLHSDIETESVNIDFDKELREINSITD